MRARLQAVETKKVGVVDTSGATVLKWHTKYVGHIDKDAPSVVGRSIVYAAAGQDGLVVVIRETVNRPSLDLLGHIEGEKQ